MNFLKQNLFLVIVAATVVIVGGVLLVLGAGAAGEVEERLERREQVSRQLRSLQNRPVNEAILENERDRVARIRQAAQQLAARLRDYNHEDYQVMQVEFTAGDGQQQTVPAFPVNRSLYRDYALWLPVVQKYGRQLAEELLSLKPARQPTEEEIAERIAIRLQQLEMEADSEREKGLGTSGLDDRADREEFEERFEEDWVPDRYERTARPDGPGARDLKQIADEQGRFAARYYAATQGWMYADISAFDRVFVEVPAQPSYAELWQAQVNLWATQDIVAAIRQTNESAFQMQKRRDPNNARFSVLNAPIKRLVDIQVDEQYYILPSAPKSTAERSTGGGSTPPWMRDGGGDGDRTARETEGTLTRHGTNKQYEVVHYDFTVVMSHAWVQWLQRELSEQNLHTVLKVEVLPLQAAVSRGDESLGDYYYGPDPVVQVRIRGELLLMTSWTRGMYLQEENAWSEAFPPLTPEEVLERLRQRAEGLLRPEDMQRVGPASPTDI